MIALTIIFWCVKLLLFRTLNFFLTNLTEMGEVHLQIKKQFIDGKWVHAERNESREVINPFNKEVIAKVTESDKTDAKKAILAARNAFDHGEWPTMSATE